jgi:predicted ATPase
MLLHSITLTNLLSFNETTLDLRPLNVLIGPNASGKSNLISAIGLLKAAPGNLIGAVMWGGGVRQWISQGQPSRLTAKITAQVELPKAEGLLEYFLEFCEHDRSFSIAAELLRSVNDGRVFFERGPAHVRIQKVLDEPASETDIPESQSLLAAYRDPTDPGPTTRLGEEFGAIRTFHEFNTSPLSQARGGASVGLQKDFLLDGGGNLALILQNLSFRGKLERLTEYLRRFWDGAEDIRINLEGGIAQTYVKERGIADPISAWRLSDGTLKFLCLLAVLLHPEPPPLICIEEPELGLHPDAVTVVADLLREASEKCQVIVTTHSEALVGAFSDEPEAVVVCERGPDGGTQFNRLQSSELDKWLERYRLGELWRMGEIGGNRW